MERRAILWFVIVVFLLALAGCGLRSISDSGYGSDSGRRGPGADNPFYKGELNEFDVLGIDRSAKISETDIQKSFEAKKEMSIKKGSSIMLIQSGAIFPDGPMVKSLEKYYNVAEFTGVPEKGEGSNYSLVLRLAAAKGGYEKIVVYWGILETGQENLVTKTVSWVPIVGWGIPDEKQRMRIRLKVAVIDVKTGQWEMFSPEPIESGAYSAILSRKAADQDQVTFLKEKAYPLVAEDIVKRYAR